MKNKQKKHNILKEEDIFKIISTMNHKNSNIFDIFDIFEQKSNINEDNWFYNQLSKASDAIESAYDASVDAGERVIRDLDARRKKAVDWTADHMYQGYGKASPGVIAAADLVADDAPKVLKNTYKGLSRNVNSLKRKVDKKLNFDGGDIKQGLTRIKSNKSHYLPSIKAHFALFGTICYKNLKASEKTSFDEPAFVDPGAYCISEQLKNTMDSWYQEKRRIFVLKYFQIKDEDDSAKISLVSAFLKNFYRVITKSSDSGYSNMIPFDEASKYINLLVEDPNFKNIFSKNWKKQLNNQAPCIIDVFPIVFTTVFYTTKRLQGQEKFVNNLDNIAKNVLNSKSYSSYLEDKWLDEVFIRYIIYKKKYRDTWRGFCYNIAFDPYAEKDFEFWTSKTKFAGRKSPLYTDSYSKSQDQLYDIAGAMAYGIAEFGAAQYLLNKTIRVAKAVATKTKPSQVRGHPIAVLGVMASVYILGIWDPGKWNTLIDEIEKEILNMMVLYTRVIEIYEEKLKEFEKDGVDPDDLLITIDTDVILPIEKEFFKSVKELQILFDKTMRKSVQYGIEDDKIDMQQRYLEMNQFSDIIAWINESFSKENTNFTKGTEIDKELLVESRKDLLLSRMALKLLLDEITKAEAEREKEEKDGKKPIIYRKKAQFQQILKPKAAIDSAEAGSPRIMGQTLDENSLILKELSESGITQDWRGVLENIYSINISDLLSEDDPEILQNLLAQARDFSRDVISSIEEMKKVVNNIESTRNNPSALSDEIVKYAINFKEWWEAGEGSIPGNTENEKGEFFTIKDRNFMMKERCYRSQDMINGKYLWLIIGPGLGQRNTCFFDMHPLDVTKIILNHSKAIRGSNGKLRPVKGTKPRVEIGFGQSLGVFGRRGTKQKINNMIKTGMAARKHVTSNLPNIDGDLASISKNRIINILLQTHVQLLTWTRWAWRNISKKQFSGTTGIRNSANKLHSLFYNYDASEEARLVGDIRIKGVKRMIEWDSMSDFFDIYDNLSNIWRYDEGALRVSFDATSFAEHPFGGE